MSTPHDYYEYGPDHEHPHLHNKGEGRPYIEPDWFANHHDGALPVISTIGRGPKGYGLWIEKNDKGDLIVGSDDPMQDEPITFHIGDWDIWVEQDLNKELPVGQNTAFTVRISDGYKTVDKEVIVPCGSQGSRIFLSADEGPVARRSDNTYIIRNVWPWSQNRSREVGFPEARVGDMVFFKVDDSLAVGQIEYVREPESGVEPGFVVYTDNLYFKTFQGPAGKDGEDGSIIKHVSFTTQYQFATSTMQQGIHSAIAPLDGVFVVHVDHLDEFVPLSVSYAPDGETHEFNRSRFPVYSALTDISVLAAEYYGMGFYYKTSDSGGYDIFLAHQAYKEFTSADRSEVADFVNRYVSVTSGSYTLAEHSDEEPVHDLPAISDQFIEPGDILGFIVCGSDDADPVIASSFNDEVIHVSVGHQVGDQISYQDKPFYLFYFDEHEGPMGLQDFYGNIKIDYDKTEDFILYFDMGREYAGTPHIQLTWKQPAPGTTKQIEEHTATFDITIGEYSCTVYIDIPAGTLNPVA